MLDQELIGLESVLNLGAGDYFGTMSHEGIWHHFNKYKRRVAIDANPLRVETWKDSGWETYCHTVQIGCILPFEKKEFDIVVGTDFLEHLSNNTAKWLMLEAEYIAKKYVIWFTPIGFMDTEKYQAGLVTCDYDKHLSGFTPDFFTSQGYEVQVYDVFHIYGDKTWGAMWAWKDVS
jgi:hypothetical protein